MSLLMGKMDQAIKEKPEIGSDVGFIDTYATGVEYLDYRLGSVDTTHNALMTGIKGGKLTTFVGPSGGGKTTLAIQAACSHVDQYENGIIHHFDFEHATEVGRVKQITGWSDEKFEAKYRFLNSGISSDSLYVYCKEMHKIKMENFDTLAYDTGLEDRNGDAIKQLPPTVVIVDAIPSMYAKKIVGEDEMGGQMDVTAQAKINNQMIRRLSGSSILQEANISIFAINHITQAVAINQFEQKPKALNFLKKDESLPGGTGFTYMASTLLKLSPGKAIDEETEYGIKGFINKIMILKNRSNESGREIELIFSQSEGFINELSSLHLLRTMKILKGNGRAYYIDGYDTTKFTLKTFREKYNTIPEFKLAFDDYMATKILPELIPGSGKLSDLLDSVMEQTSDMPDGTSVIDIEEV